jgi:hypothetical protein
MRRRLYFVLPDVDSARRTADDLLLARVEDRRMHFLARRGTDLGELRPAGYLMKGDALHGAGVGLGLGVLGGLVVGALILFNPIEGTEPHPIALFVAAVLGGALGAWISSMVGASVPNSRLKEFEADIAAGKVLLMLDVPVGALERIREIVLRRHPEAVPRGQVRPYPVFP